MKDKEARKRLDNIEKRLKIQSEFYPDVIRDTDAIEIFTRITKIERKINEVINSINDILRFFNIQYKHTPAKYELTPKTDITMEE